MFFLPNVQAEPRPLGAVGSGAWLGVWGSRVLRHPILALTIRTHQNIPLSDPKLGFKQSFMTAATACDSADFFLLRISQNEHNWEHDESDKTDELE